MLAGERPKECSYCWKVEDLKAAEAISDRFYKSADTWSLPYIDQIEKMPWDRDVVPKYLEVSFSNICNFKCAYCFPDVSSLWMSEVLQHGPYPTSEYNGSMLYLKKQGTMPLGEGQNPYTQAFWEWLPLIINELHVLRVTGGEPLLSKDCQKLLDFLFHSGNSKIQLSVNSNLGVPTPLVEKMISRLQELADRKKISEAQVFTSLDCWGEQAEYIRFGLKLSLWQKNLALCLEHKMKVVVMVTFNALSPFSFLQLLEFVLEQKANHEGRLEIDISILHRPDFLSVAILKPDHIIYLERSFAFMKANSSRQVSFGFYDHELTKMERLLEFAKQRLRPRQLAGRRDDFVAFFQEYDLRKKSDFKKTFPELAPDFEQWNQDFGSRVLPLRSTRKFLSLLQKWLGRILVRAGKVH